MIKIFTFEDKEEMKKLNIIHVDMDAFYASVEESDNPRLKGLPVIVGGLSNHGIVTTANYHARKYGVHSAMPTFMANKKCPKGYFLPPRMERYKEVSRQIFNILYEFTDLVEQVSIDEAYLDISNINMDPITIVNNIKKRVLEDTGLTMSVGISYNKFLAKIASDWNKPNGIMIITEDMVPRILEPLSVKSIHGIGPKSSNKLNSIGINKVEDLLRLSEDFLVELFGKSGTEIYHRVRGVDKRKINIERERKSLGIERTLDKSIKDKDVIKENLEIFSKELSSSLIREKIHTRTITLKIKDSNFIVQTRSKTLNDYISSKNEIFEVAVRLLDDISIINTIRLIGLTSSNFISSELKQLSFFD